MQNMRHPVPLEPNTLKAYKTYEARGKAYGHRDWKGSNPITITIPLCSILWGTWT